MLPGVKSAIHNIQALRAFSAIVVVFVHLDVLLSAVGLQPFGWGGVDVFFVISGFIMVYTTIGRNMTPWNFAALRLSRVAPLYWFITLAVFAMAVVAPSLLQSTKASLPHLIQSLAFIPFRREDGVVEPILFVGWTLNYELFFYLLFTIGLFLRSRTHGVALVCAAIAILVVGGSAIHSPSLLAGFYTSPIMLDFLMGMALGLGEHVLRAGPALHTKRTALSLSTAGLVLLALATVAFYPSSLPSWPRVLIIGVPGLIAVGGAIALETWGWVLKNRVVAMLGNASFSIYLISPFVTQVAQKAQGKLHAHGLAAWVLIVLTLIGVCAVGTVVHLYLERPLSKLAKRALGATGRLVPPVAPVAELPLA